MCVYDITKYMISQRLYLFFFRVLDTLQKYGVHMPVRFVKDIQVGILYVFVSTQFGIAIDYFIIGATAWTIRTCN